MVMFWIFLIKKEKFIMWIYLMNNVLKIGKINMIYIYFFEFLLFIKDI